MSSPYRTKETLRWRDVFDSKVPGQYVLVAAQRAKDARYKYMCFNEQIHDVTGEYPEDTGLTAKDVL